MQVVEGLLTVLKWFAPVAVVALAILTAWGIIKWTRRLGKATMELSKNPFSLVFGLVVIGLFVFLFFKYLNPLLQV